jgi:hypothetical protein
MVSTVSVSSDPVTIFDLSSNIVKILIDCFSAILGRTNITTGSQCGRSPDTMAYSGRCSSAMGMQDVTKEAEYVHTSISHIIVKNSTATDVSPFQH